MRPDLLAVALVAGGALAFEVLLTRLLAIIHWHHFTGMVISLALLGYGASGAVLTPLLDRLRPRAVLAFAAGATLFGATALAAFAMAQALPFNALEVVWNPQQWLWLALLYLLFAVPFFFAAACTGLALGCFPAPIGRIYGADLLGAATGALAAVGLLEILRPDLALPLIAAAGPLAAAIVLASAHRHRAAGGAAACAVLIGLAAAAGWPGLQISPFKPLPQTLLVEGTEIIAERTSPIGLVEVVRSGRIPFRSVTGLSLANHQEPAPQLGAFMDGEGPVPITRFTDDFGRLGYLEATLAALPYRVLGPSPGVLLLGLGGGTDLLLAQRHAARSVDVVEPDGSVADLLRGEFSGFSGGILDRPEVRLHVGAARRFVLLVRRTPFGEGELAAINAFAEVLGFDLGWHHGMQRETADRFNILGEPVFFDSIAALTGPDRARFVADYAFDIRAATDDRPYFHDFFRWRALPALWAAAREGNAGLLDWGWPVQLATLGIAVFSGLVLILLPARLLAGRAEGRLRRATGAYFLLIGIGFMFVEIAALQRLVLLLGAPVHAFAVTLSAFLAFAGIGSGVAARLDAARSSAEGPWTPGPTVLLLSIAAFAALHALAEPELFGLGPGLGTVPRAALAAAMIAPLALAMGLPFPLVLARLRASTPVLVPWAWGVNGCASVVAAVLAGLLAMSLGARSLMTLGGLAYMLAAPAWRGGAWPTRQTAGA